MMVTDDETFDVANETCGEIKPEVTYVKNTPKKFQKLVLQTLTQKDCSIDDSSGSDENFELPQFVGTTLDLTKKRLKEFPADLLRLGEFVQYLYLESNKLTILPGNFFQSLSHLKWLDLRHNELESLPSAGLGNHSSLEFLLLQANRIKNLPTELGLLPKLKGLQITGNPIVNVPYDVIAHGFYSIMKHLRKLHCQENILLPNSDAIVVKPSIPKDEYADKLGKKCIESIDDGGKNDFITSSTSIKERDKNKSRTYNDLSYKYDGLNRKYYVLLDMLKDIKRSLLKTNLCSRHRLKVVSSNYHYVKKRHSRLGYKTKIITPDVIEEKIKRELQMLKRKEILEKQARKIQRMKDKEVLNLWRHRTKRTVEQTKLLDNYQQYPSRNFIACTPFDVDPEFLNMLNRIDLYRSLKEFESMRKKRKSIHKLKLSLGELEKQMKEITQKLEHLNVKNDVSLMSKRKHLCNKIDQVKEIQKMVQNLQLQNVSLSEIPCDSTTA